jgi:hypothetical protein
MFADIGSFLEATVALTMTPPFVGGDLPPRWLGTRGPYLECVSKTVTAVTLSVTFGAG